MSSGTLRPAAVPREAGDDERQHLLFDHLLRAEASTKKVDSANQAHIREPDLTRMDPKAALERSVTPCIEMLDKQGENAACRLLLTSEGPSNDDFVVVDSVPLLCESCDLPVMANRIAVDDAAQPSEVDASLAELHLVHSPIINAHFNQSQ